MMMEGWDLYLKVATLVLGATGIWKVIELLIRARFDKRLRSAETKNLHVQAEGQIVGNWIQWSQHLEQRVKELEVVAKENRKLMKMVESQSGMIESQKNRIFELEQKMKTLQKENLALRKQILALSK
jgi:septal ring factor EnvC (AmiA/AmiB activator)